jgi:hypothetical protein
MQLDTGAMNEAGIATDHPITMEVKGVSLGSALRLLLEPLELTYVVTDGVLLVTTPAAVSKMVELRVYNVAELAGAAGKSGDLTTVLGLALAPGTGMLAPGQPATLGGSSQPQFATFGDVIVVRASIAEQEAIAALLVEMQTKQRGPSK